MYANLGNVKFKLARGGPTPLSATTSNQRLIFLSVELYTVMPVDGAMTLRLPWISSRPSRSMGDVSVVELLRVITIFPVNVLQALTLVA